MGIRELKLAAKLNRMSDEALESQIGELRVKYKITDEDWSLLVMIVATKTSRDIMNKIGGA